jgi:hypothetical protein
MRLTTAEPGSWPGLSNPSETHPTSAALERFVRGELPSPEVRPIIRHLLTGCPRCVGVTRRVWRFDPASVSIPQKETAPQPNRCCS